MPPTVLWISDSPHLPTGWGRVSQEILRRLVRFGSLDIHALAIGANESVCGKSKQPFIMWPHSEPAASRETVEKTVQKLRPDVVVTLCDIWTPRYMPDILGSAPAKWIGYFPIDAGPLPTYFASLVEQMDRRVTTSDFSASVFRRAFSHLDIGVIKHGVDTDIFLPGPSTLGKPMLPDGRTAFVVGCVARNQPRKGLPLLLKAFAHFAQNHDDAVLYLHTNPWDSEGWVLQELLTRHAILERTHFTQAMLRFESLPDKDLRNIYRSFDVFALPTMGEGFGIPLLEAMACGVPVVATEGSAVSELLEGRGELIPTAATLTIPPHGFEAGLADVDKLAEALEKLYQDPALRAEYGRRGRAFAETLTWDRAASQWNRLLEEVLAEAAPKGLRPASRCRFAEGSAPLVPLLEMP